jgi:hypothetical protein
MAGRLQQSESTVKTGRISAKQNCCLNSSSYVAFASEIVHVNENHVSEHPTAFQKPGLLRTFKDLRDLLETFKNMSQN